jgi:hypothetical protein
MVAESYQQAGKPDIMPTIYTAAAPAVVKLRGLPAAVLCANLSLVNFAFAQSADVQEIIINSRSIESTLPLELARYGEDRLTGGSGSGSGGGGWLGSFFGLQL